MNTHNRIKKSIIISITLIVLGFSISLSTAGIQHNTVAEYRQISTRDSGVLTVYYIDVGQGDSILIETPENNYMLIDAGTYNTPPYVPNFLSSLGVTTLQVFVATHPHADHIGQAAAVLNMCTVLSIYHPGMTYNSATYRSFIAAAQAEGCPIYTDDNVNPGDYIPIDNTITCQILYLNKNASDANDASIVLKVIYGQVSFLFTGDASSATDSTLVPNWDINCDILKVSHHGSYSSSSNYFLDEATPAVSVISCGLNNSYGHPHQETLDRLRAHNSSIYRTDLNGTVTVTTDGASWNISYEKPQTPPMQPILNGPLRGIKGQEYTYTVNTRDPNGESVYYLVDWGDGNMSSWLGPYGSGQTVTASHLWSTRGTYQVKAKAKDASDAESGWSVPLIVNIFKLGDVNNDGWVSWRDIDPFVAAIGTTEEQFQTQYPSYAWIAADCNQDGYVNWRDINPFVALMNT